MYFKSLWSESPYIPEIFSTVMNRNRAMEIKKYIRFDDQEEGKEKLKEDKLPAISELCQLIVNQIKSSYVPRLL